MNRDKTKALEEANAEWELVQKREITEIALNCLREGIDINDISEITGLSIVELEELKKQIP